MSQYFENDTKVKSKERIVQIKIKNTELKFLVDNGVFSKKGLDFGTRTLLETIDTSNIEGKILDFGCGYGPIGIYLSKTTTAEVDMLDINKRAISLAKKNSELNKVKTNIFESNIYSNVSKKYDFIITNPPIRVGKKILYEILFNAQNYLNDKGELWLVINKDQGAKSLFKDLSEKYETSIVEKNKGFYVIRAINN